MNLPSAFLTRMQEMLVVILAAAIAGIRSISAEL